MLSSLWAKWLSWLFIVSETTHTAVKATHQDTHTHALAFVWCVLGLTGIQLDWSISWSFYWNYLCWGSLERIKSVSLWSKSLHNTSLCAQQHWLVAVNKLLPTYQGNELRMIVQIECDLNSICCVAHSLSLPLPLLSLSLSLLVYKTHGLPFIWLDKNSFRSFGSLFYEFRHFMCMSMLVFALRVAAEEAHPPSIYCLMMLQGNTHTYTHSTATYVCLCVSDKYSY